ncbi:YjbH domain-containing protein [Stenotrophomonas maltophilia group sp. msm1]|uniref:YjbH domain-containing protein n=1 Tax=Stenotrophomonas maltophilia group sp. msm1 TaxID=3061099 RepID=UPI002894694B|nr:YjbH domain-containing protein [Stenotrophomonas maltophilia group sp. msm1]MDT3558113.1 YjbH domain-containing protein [Stenotrophomonas maltophilia group sp. msm1]
MTQPRLPPHLLHPAKLTLSALALSLPLALHAQEAPPATANEWGAVGLLQTPTARMAHDGDLNFTASYNAPYARYNLTLQPLPWLETSFRYINVNNLLYGRSVAGDQHYKDKSIDFKLRLWKESRLLPEVAFGVRDLGGTGFFSSEYVVANKNFGPIDASLGFATGYLGNRGDFSNPLGAIDDRFKDRRPIANSDITQAGKFGLSNMFKGPVGIFGGITYQTPMDELLLKVEYDGNDYRREPRGNNLRQRAPINVGVVYLPSPNVELTAAWERGDAAMFSLTLRGNPGNAPAAPKPFDPPPQRLLPEATTPAQGTIIAPAAEAPDWAAITSELQRNAGFRVERISRRGDELFIDGYQTRYLHASKGLGRATRILSNATGDNYDWYTLRTTRVGMPIADLSINRKAFAGYLDGTVSEDVLRRSTELQPPDKRAREILYTPKRSPFGGGFNIGYRQNLGGPDGFILYQVAANYSGSLFLLDNIWLTGTVSADITNNYHKFKYNAPSRLPRVRTDIRQYLTTSDVMLPNLQANIAGRLAPDLYGIAYAGYLEWMYAGVGGELLYRPNGERWALGANLNRVQQRDYDQHWGLRDYLITTGHATLYYAFDARERIIGSLSVGQYLAGDKGATLDIARVFDNGVTMGAYATKTNVSARDFGEGSFDKGIYFSIPLDGFLPRSTRGRAAFNWNPLIRDGGAMLGRKYSLYGMTGDRDERFFYDNLRAIGD